MGFPMVLWFSYGFPRENRPQQSLGPIQCRAPEVYTEISQAALEEATKSFRANGLTIETLQGDLFDALQGARRVTLCSMVCWG